MRPPSRACPTSSEPVVLQPDRPGFYPSYPGIPAKTIEGALDFTVRVSSREAYVSPTRGAQGNALKTIFAMPFVLDGERGWVEIESGGIRHVIDFRVDPIRQEPVIDRVQ